MSKCLSLIVSVILGLSLSLEININEISAQVISVVEGERLLQEGLKYLRIYKSTEAIQSFQQSLEIYQQIGNRNIEAKLLINIGIAYRRIGQYQKAIDFYQRALAIEKADNDPSNEGNALNGLGLAYTNLGQYQKAIEFHLQSLAVLKKIGDREGEGIAFNNLGNVYDGLGQYQKAITFYLQALEIDREIGDREGEGSSFGNLGNAYYSLGQYQKAIEYHLQSLEISQKLGNQNGEGSSLNNLGNAYYSLGQYQKAIDFIERSLVVFKQTGNRTEQANCLNNLANNYKNLGQYFRAIDYYQQSLAIKKEIGSLEGQANSLGNIGSTYDDLGEYQKAIGFHNRALITFRQIGDLNGVGKTLNNLGSAYHSLEQYQKAIDYYQQSLTIKKKIGDRSGEGSTLGNLGNIYDNLGQYQKAIEFQQQSLLISRELGDRSTERNTLSNLGVTLVKLDQTELAILAYKQSVNTTEAIREDIRSLDKDEQKSYLETVEGSYRRLADLLLQKGRVIEALQVLDLLKIQELEDYFNEDIKKSFAINRGIKLLLPELALGDRLLNVNTNPKIKLNTTALNRELADRIKQLPPTITNQVPIYLQKIPKNAVLLYPLVLENRLEIIIFTKGKPPVNRKVAIKKAELEELIKDFRSDLQNTFSQDTKISGKKVYDLLIKPIEVELEQSKTILYAPDGIMRYIPLSALYDGKQWLVEKYQVNNLIAYSLFNGDRRAQTNLRIFAGAFGGKDGEIRFGNKGLAASIPEVENITKTFANVTKLVEKDFTAESVREQIIGSTIVHFATHAEFNTGSPWDSFILFGDGSKVTLAEIGEWQLKSADLVVLSACETGIGTLGTGTEILGFGYQVQKAGAKSAMVSLWTVSDSGTQVLMNGFYQNFKNQIQTPNILTAMRQSQIAMIKKIIKKGDPNFNHPYFWSGFVAIGNAE